MDGIPKATEEEAAQVPGQLRELQDWLRAMGKPDSMVKQVAQKCLTLFEEDGKSFSSMATDQYYELVRVSPKNRVQHNKRSSAVRYLIEFWAQRPPGPPAEPGPGPMAARQRRSPAAPGSAAPGSSPAAPGSTGERQAETPARGTVDPKPSSPGSGGPGTPDGRTHAKDLKREKEKRRRERIDKATQKRRKREKEGEKHKPPRFTPLAAAHGADEVLDQAKQLAAERRLAGALCLLGRDPSLKNASVNGVYLDRGRPFHGRPSYKKEGGDRFLFFSATKGAWKVSDKLDDTKTGFAFAKVEDRGKALPSDAKEQFLWRIFGGKVEGYKKDRAFRCLSAPVLLRTLAPEVALALNAGAGEAGASDESEGEQGSGESSCQQGSDRSSDDEKGTVSSSSSSGGED